MIYTYNSDLRLSSKGGIAFSKFLHALIMQNFWLVRTAIILTFCLPILICQMGWGTRASRHFQPSPVKPSRLLFHHQWIVRLFCKQLLMALLATFTRAMTKIVTTLQNKGNDALLAGIFPNKAGRKPQYHAEPKQKVQILSPRELEVLNLISFAIYRDVFAIFTWYIVPPRTIEPDHRGQIVH